MRYNAGMAGKLIPEERIPGDRVVWPLRVPMALVKRLEELRAYVNERPEYAWGALDLKGVARLALLKGIEALERERERRNGKAGQ